MGGPAGNGAGKLAWLASNGRVRVHSGGRIRTFTVADGCSVMSFAGRSVLLGCRRPGESAYLGQLLNTVTGRLSDIPHDRRDGTTWWRMGTKWLVGSGEGEVCGGEPYCNVRMHRRTGRRETYSSRNPVAPDALGPDFDLNTESGAPGPQWRITYAENGTITAHRAGKRWRVTRRDGTAQINSAGIVGLVARSDTRPARVYVTDPRRKRVKRIMGLRRRYREGLSEAYPLRGKLVVVVSRFLPTTSGYSTRRRLIETDLPF